MWLELKEEIEIELNELQSLFIEFKPLMIKVQSDIPNFIETVALAGLLHSFYTGIENIFKRVVLNLDDSVPRSETWHIQILNSMVTQSANRPAVISASLRDKLTIFLQFRHVFRHAYSFYLQWNKMKPLVLECENTLKQLEKEITKFLEKINS